MHACSRRGRLQRLLVRACQQRDLGERSDHLLLLLGSCKQSSELDHLSARRSSARRYGAQELDGLVMILFHDPGSYLRARGETQLRKNVFHVPLCRALRDYELFGDGFVGQALRN